LEIQATKQDARTRDLGFVKETADRIKEGVDGKNKRKLEYKSAETTIRIKQAKQAKAIMGKQARDQESRREEFDKQEKTYQS
jgi:hypothetical protein